MSSKKCVRVMDHTTIHLCSHSNDLETGTYMQNLGLQSSVYPLKVSPFGSKTKHVAATNTVPGH